LATITGSAGHPSAFDSYTLEYNNLSDPNAPWTLAQEAVRQQVQDSVLGAWNTIFVPDGVYALRLRVTLTDGQVGETIVSNLRVINSEPTPVPPPATGLTEATSVGPTPTSAIEQPPSNNPSPDQNDSGDTGNVMSGSAGSNVATTNSNQPTTETRINTGRVQSAFCTGVYLTFGVFAIMIVYSLLRGRFRPFARRMVVQVRDEYDTYE
ncbi:MAG: hypothetical protein JXA10_16115, partial [Anaerolineae bacterium]|nr:hypothetical protein [Anaerolineae bacterium]